MPHHYFSDPLANDQMIASYGDREGRQTVDGQQDRPSETNEGYSAMIIFSRGAADDLLSGVIPSRLESRSRSRPRPQRELGIIIFIISGRARENCVRAPLH